MLPFLSINLGLYTELMDLVLFIAVIISTIDPCTKTEIKVCYVVEYSLCVTQKMKNITLEIYFDLSVRPGLSLG
jgi:hypothetical protein